MRREITTRDATTILNRGAFDTCVCPTPLQIWALDVIVLAVYLNIFSSLQIALVQPDASLASIKLQFGAPDENRIVFWGFEIWFGILKDQASGHQASISRGNSDCILTNYD